LHRQHRCPPEGGRHKIKKGWSKSSEKEEADPSRLSARHGGQAHGADFGMTTLEKIADLRSFVIVGGMTTQRKRHFFGNIFGSSSVCIGDCKLREMKSDGSQED